MPKSRQEADPRADGIIASMRRIPDCPVPGVLYYDITTLMADVKAFKDSLDIIIERYRGASINAVASIESRGFIFAPMVAQALGVPFLPIRYPGKLPGERVAVDYMTELGPKRLEAHTGIVNEDDRVLLMDDLIASGCTMAAAARLLAEELAVDLVECCCVVEIPDLGGRARVLNAGFSFFSAVEVPITHSELRTRGERLTKIDGSHGRNSTGSDDSHADSPTRRSSCENSLRPPVLPSFPPPLRPLL